MDWSIRELQWTDHPLAEVATPGGNLRLTLGLGSGLTHRADDPPERLWAVGDRGANIKIKPAVKDFGLTHLAKHGRSKGAKVIPRPDLGPAIAELTRTEDAIGLVRILPLKTPDGRPFTGLPLPGAAEAEMELALTLEGEILAPDPAGADTEAIVALSDGTFWVSEEYGPSLMRVAADGTVIARWLPEGSTVETAPPATACLPAIAARRRLNRGFEAMAVSPDEQRLIVALQSAVEGEALVRIWTLDATTGALIAEHLYEFDAPKTFARDAALGKVGEDDLKVCEIACVREGGLLVLERICATAKIYRVDLGWARKLKKTLIFSTDDAPQVAPDLEGMAIVSDHALILVTDNDFGVEGAATRFYELSFTRPLFG